jgi:hypothetical protein
VSAVIRNNTIVNNTWNGISSESDESKVTITNNIVSHNGNGISINTGSLIYNSYNDIYGNNNDLANLEAGTGDINKDPLYADLQGKKYTLTSSSPALDAGDPDNDGDGKDWINDADDRDPDTTRMDMGALFLDQRLLTPDAPSGLTSVSCNDIITLKWRKNTSPYFLRYRIYGGPSPDPATKIDSTSNNVADTMKLITGLTHGQTYHFMVVAVNRGGTVSTGNNQTSARIQAGLVPKIKAKWQGDVLICYNVNDSISQYQWYKGGSQIAGATGQYYVTGNQTGIYSIETIDISGCRNTSKLISVPLTKSVTVYPNPASERFLLRINDGCEGRGIVSIISSSGRKVLEVQKEFTCGEIFGEIPISDLEEGVYFIHVYMNNKESYNTSLIISH